VNYYFSVLVYRALSLNNLSIETYGSFEHEQQVQWQTWGGNFNHFVRTDTVRVSDDTGKWSNALINERLIATFTSFSHRGPSHTYRLAPEPDCGWRLCRVGRDIEWSECSNYVWCANELIVGIILPGSGLGAPPMSQRCRLMTQSVILPKEPFRLGSHKYSFIFANRLSRTSLPSIPTLDDVTSAYFHSWDSLLSCRVLDEWPTSRTSSSGARNFPFIGNLLSMPSHTRMGDIASGWQTTQSVIDSLISDWF